MRIFSKRSLVAAVAAGAAIVTAVSVGGVAAAGPGAATGPSSSDPPYLVRHVPGTTFTSVLTVGDSVGGYRMVASRTASGRTTTATAPSPS